MPTQSRWTKRNALKWIGAESTEKKLQSIRNYYHFSSLLGSHRTKETEAKDERVTFDNDYLFGLEEEIQLSTHHLQEPLSGGKGSTMDHHLVRQNTPLLSLVPIRIPSAVLRKQAHTNPLPRFSSSTAPCRGEFIPRTSGSSLLQKVHGL